MKSKCKTCKKEFEYKIYSSKGIFCSKECHHKFQSKNSIKTKCKLCGKEIKVEYKRHLNGKGKFCSKQCYSNSMKKYNLKKDRASINRDYRRNNPLKCKIWKHNRKMLELNLGGKMTETEWLEIISKHNNKCALCNKKVKLTIDHKIPITKWNEYVEKHKDINYKCGDKENIQPLCRSCNSKKSNSIKI